MSAPALEALAAAKAAGVKLILEGQDIIRVTPKLPSAVVDLLRAVKPDLLGVLRAGRPRRPRLTLIRRRAVRSSAGRRLSWPSAISSERDGPIRRR